MILTVINAEPAGFEHDTLVAIIVDRDFRVARVTGVDIGVITSFGLVSQTTAVADDARGMRRNAKPPASDICLVRTLVSKVTIPIMSLPVPVIMEVGSGVLR